MCDCESGSNRPLFERRGQAPGRQTPRRQLSAAAWSPAITGDKPLNDASITAGPASIDRQLPLPVVYPLTDNNKLVALLCELLEKPDSWVHQHLHEEELCLGKHHREEFARSTAKPHVWNERMAEYYQHSRVGQISLVPWNRCPEKVQMREWIGQHLAKSGRSLKVLVIGDGAGFDSMYLSQCGHDVTYSELSQWAIRFARLLFEETNSPVRLVTRLQDIEPADWDVVVCLDVLEHVPDPEALVADIAGYLRPDGQLVVHAPFFFVSPMCPNSLEVEPAIQRQSAPLPRAGLRPRRWPSFLGPAGARPRERSMCDKCAGLQNMVAATDRPVAGDSPHLEPAAQHDRPPRARTN